MSKESTKPKIIEVVGKFTYGLGEPTKDMEIETSHYCDLNTDKKYELKEGKFVLVAPKVFFKVKQVLKSTDK